MLALLLRLVFQKFCRVMLKGNKHWSQKGTADLSIINLGEGNDIPRGITFLRAAKLILLHVLL
jgi:hypothetical protein